MKNKQSFIFCIFFLLLSFSASAIEYTENSDQSCDINGLCTTTIYSYQKYYQEQGQWKQIDENFGTQNCQPGYTYCVDGNLYQFHIKNAFSNPLVTYGNTRLSFNLVNFGSLPLAPSLASVQGNTVTYANVIPNVDVKYTYLPHKVKEEIIIKDRRPFTPFTNDISLEFTLNPYTQAITTIGNALKIGDLYITDLVAYDNKSNTISIPFSITGNTLRMTLPIQWLKNETTVYPIIIDPTIQTNLSIIKDLHVQYVANLALPIYSRADSTSRLSIGYEDDSDYPLAADNLNLYRSYLIWDITPIPDAAAIKDINLTLTTGQVGSPLNFNISLKHMDNNVTYYPDDLTASPCLGNCQFFNDMGNGTAYTTIRYATGGKHYMNLSNATTDMQNSLSANTFHLGLFAVHDGGIPPIDSDNITNIRIYKPSETASAADRPVLKVIYSVAGANETEGESAITQGILNSLPTAVIHTEQQVYTRNSVNTQQSGRFDRVAVFNNQRWAFNYVTSGESFTNMNNISTNFYVLELTDLFASDITAQVSAFINATKN